MLYSLTKHMQKLRWQHQANKSILASLYATPPPAANKKINDLSFIVIDCEMTGLNANQDQLLSIGWVEIINGQIDLSTAHYSLIYSEQSVEQSATIHGIKDKELAGGISISRALARLISALNNKVAIFHHAPLDLAFLQKQSMRLFGAPLYCAVVDTMAIEQKRLNQQGTNNSLQLADVRSRYNLSRAPQHQALADALATAELFLAQCSYKGSPELMCLEDLGVRCA